MISVYVSDMKYNALKLVVFFDEIINIYVLKILSKINGVGDIHYVIVLNIYT